MMASGGRRLRAVFGILSVLGALADRRYLTTGFHIRLQCEYNNTNQRQYQCKTLTRQEVRRAHQMFYGVPDKIKQDEIILRFVIVSSVHRKFSRKDLFKNQVAIKYVMPKLNGDYSRANVLVCKKAFTDIFVISKKKRTSKDEENRIRKQKFKRQCLTPVTSLGSTKSSFHFDLYHADSLLIMTIIGVFTRVSERTQIFLLMTVQRLEGEARTVVRLIASFAIENNAKLDFPVTLFSRRYSSGGSEKEASAKISTEKSRKW
ncbi:Hypothetical protein CINCED_3A023410 [Cinara cedri]|uniref:Uncharacterized protein n=1 Tax=Cinara cedri TaxID=506608 RepID=A0A5E4MIG7_9HEMI|nr:Hypothetical protein CINCED_3A023410 [Cinara cedri]